MPQDVALYVARLSAGSPAVRHELAPGCHAWVQIASGSVALNGLDLSASGGAAINDEARLELAASEDAEVLLFGRA